MGEKNSGILGTLEFSCLKPGFLYDKLRPVAFHDKNGIFIFCHI